MFSRTLILLSLLVASTWAHASSPFAHCYASAQRDYGIDARLLRAIAIVESSEKPEAINSTHIERTGSEDIGLMQINSRHLRRLKPLGIERDDLLQPCVSVHVGAWLLADLVSRMGPTWKAVGAYNAACSQLKGDDCTEARNRYTTKVKRALARIAQPGSNPWPPAQAQRELVAMTFDVPRVANPVLINTSAN